MGTFLIVLGCIIAYLLIGAVGYGIGMKISGATMKDMGDETFPCVMFWPLVLVLFAGFGIFWCCWKLFKLSLKHVFRIPETPIYSGEPVPIMTHVSGAEDEPSVPVEIMAVEVEEVLPPQDRFGIMDMEN